jgi:prevent-host-death family protein
MEKTVSAYEARRNFGKYLQDVVAKGDNIVVERHGEPVAVVVPLAVYEQWQRSRERFFNWLRETSERIDAPEDEAEEIVQEAIKAVRAEKRKQIDKSA